MATTRKKAKASRTVRHPRATTLDVLTAPERDDEIPRKWRAHYTRLVELRDHLMNRKEGLVQAVQADSPNYSSHMADAGTDEYDRNLALSMVSSEQDALYEIEEALNRIRNNSYGVCELTGKAIEAERLKAIPWTRFSTDAEQKLEKERVIRRTRLPEPERVPKMSAAIETEESDDEE